MDALSTVVALLKPQAVVAKVMHGAGRWGVRYSAFGHPSFSLVLQGPCYLAVDGEKAVILETGDFILLPSTPAFTLASGPKVKPKPMRPIPSGMPVDDVFHGDPEIKPSARLLGGYFAFDPINAAVISDLLPRVLHIRAADPAVECLRPIVELIKREALGMRAGRSLLLARLVEILLVEALRSVPENSASTGFLAGLRDPRLASALRAIHLRTVEPWSLVTLAEEAGMSRSSFAERFARIVQRPPLDYLLQWRLTIAKNLLARGNMTVAEVALAVGYESASGFSTAFSREIGQAPKEFTKAQQEAAASNCRRIPGISQPSITSHVSS